jgi:UDP-GlcNAc:undecaprenyl-phosphate/decaprenyl-phosphate GlcNAc-1-phosphate transferase
MLTTHAIIVLLLSAGLTYVLTPLATHLGRRWHLVDLPGGRRKHRGRLVRIGGLALYPAFAVAVLFTLNLPRRDPLEVTRITGVLLSLGIVWVYGLLDDRYRFPPWAHFGALTMASLAAIAFKVFVEVFNNPFTDRQVMVDWYLMAPLTILWLVGMATTVNVVDGVDGLATGVTGIAALILCVHMVRLEQYTVALLPLALLGCCLGFLPYNFYQARIILGGGAFVLGFALGTLSIVAGAKVATALLVVWMPLLDIAWQLYCRWRRGQAVTLGDRGHLHFRLQDMGWTPPRIVLLYYAITAALGSAALLISSRLLKLGVMVTVGLVIVAFLVVVRHRMGDVTPTGY